MKKTIKKIWGLVWKEFVFGGHLLALGLVSLVFTSANLLNINITWDSLVVVYLMSLIPCLYGRYLDFDKDSITNLDRNRYLKSRRRRIPLIISIFGLILIGVLLYFDKFFILPFIILLIFLSFLYDKFLKKITGKIPGFKNFVTASIFASLVIFPVLYYSSGFNISLLLLIFFVYLREFIGMSFSDIKDIESDKREGLKTLVIVLGQKRFTNFLNYINLFTAVPIIIGVYMGFFPRFTLMLLLSIPYSLHYFNRLKNMRVNSTSLFNVVVDSEDIWWSIYILIGKALI